MSQTSDSSLSNEEQERMLMNLTEGDPDRVRLLRQMKNFAIDVPSIIDVMRHLEEREVIRQGTKALKP